MIKSEILRTLFESLQSQNDIEIYNSLLRLIKYERERKNYALANDLSNLIPKRFQNLSKKKKRSTLISFKIPKDSSRDLPLLEIKNFSLNPKHLILHDFNQQILTQVIQENNSKHMLEIYNIKSSSKLLFFGPPGCGKTLSAQMIASQLHLPLVYVRFDGIISSYLGETSSNLKKVFDFVSSGNWVLFFDEFDAIGKTRGDNFDNGEMKRVINSFLQQLDNYEGEAIIICATNFSISLDPALWRRFDEIVYFELPSDEMRRELYKLFLSKYPKSRLNYMNFSKESQYFSGSDIEQVCVRAIKRSILKDEPLDNDLIFKQIKAQIKRNKYKTHFSIKQHNDRTS